MSASHNDLVSLSYNLDAAPIPTTNFGDVLILIENITFGGGALAKQYASYADVLADGPSGTAVLSASAVEAGRVAFSQDRVPSSILIGTVDVAGLEDYDTALAAIIAAGWEFFAVTADLHDSTTDSAQQLLLSAAIEAQERLFVMQTDSATAYDTGTTWEAGAYAAMVGRENTVVIWHDDDTKWADVAYAISRLNYDHDVTSPTWTGPLREVDAAVVTDAQKLAIRANNINVPLPFGSETAYVDPGVNQAGTAASDGRPVDHVVSVYWWLDRLRARLQALKITYDKRGEKIPMSYAGQAILQAELEAQAQLGFQAGHFEPGQIIIELPDPIPSADITSRTLKATVTFQLRSGARAFELDFNFSATPVVELEA